MAGNREKLQAAATATGNGSVFDCRAWSTVMLQVVGTFTGTITVEGTVDGENWAAWPCVASDGTVATTITAAGLYAVSTAGLGSLRARISAYTNGTITAVARGTSRSGFTFAVV